jgi:diguanylate cyclase (GGDEF)-like protein
MSFLNLHRKGRSNSPLETGVFRIQQAESELKRVARREWWLWFSAFWVTFLSAAALILSFWPSLFRQHEHFYNLRPNQAQWSTAALLLVFNSWMLYRQWSFRRQRRKLSEHAEPDDKGSEIPVSSEAAASVGFASSSGFDPVTGMFTRASIETHLGKEIARAKRQNTPLSLATVHLEEFEQIAQRYNQQMSDLVLKEFVRKFKRAIRGSDYPVRVGPGDFVLVLPECGLNEVKTILNRIGPLEINSSGKRIAVTYSTGWVDYQQGDMPSDLLKRAWDILHLYEKAAQQAGVSTPVAAS